MKNLLKLFGVVLVAALILVSCNLEKGGTVEVTNGLSESTIVKVFKLGEDALNLGNTDVLNPGETKRWTFKEDGTYIVTAAPPLGFSQTVILLAGGTEKVTIKQ